MATELSPQTPEGHLSFDLYEYSY